MFHLGFIPFRNFLYTSRYATFLCIILYCRVQDTLKRIKVSRELFPCCPRKIINKNHNRFHQMFSSITFSSLFSPLFFFLFCLSLNRTLYNSLFSILSTEFLRFSILILPVLVSFLIRLRFWLPFVNIFKNLENYFVLSKNKIFTLITSFIISTVSLDNP